MITEPITLNQVQGVQYYKTVSVAQSARQEVTFTLTDKEGKTLDLGTNEPVQPDKCAVTEDGVDAANPGFADGIKPKREWPDVSVKLIVSPGRGSPIMFTLDGVTTDSIEGRVVFHLEPDHTNMPGMFLAEIGLFRGDLLMGRWPLYLLVEPSLFAEVSVPANTRPQSAIITLPEIRLELRDLDASFNTLLDDLEFKDAEIMAAIRKPVDKWNETLPYEPTLQFRYEHFPFRYNWIRATSGYLLEMAAHWYRRNDLEVSAGGVSVADRNKHRTYEPKAKELLDEYDKWCRQQKVARSMALAWGTVGSPWPYSGVWR